MRPLSTLLLLALATGPALLAAAEPAGCASQDAEITALKARIRELEALHKPATATAPAPTASAQAALPPASPGLAPKPPAQVVVTEVEPYSRSGCRPSLFQDIPYAIWMDEHRWEELHKGMSAVEVETLLGPEHYDTAGGGNVKWEYGKCGEQARAELLFVRGKLAEWRAPRR